MGNVNMEARQIHFRGGDKPMNVEEAIKNAGSVITPEEKAWIDTIPELASQEIIAPEFDAEEGVYAVGDLVIYQGGLYKFTTAHETAGAWNPEEVAAVKVSEALSLLESGLTNVPEHTSVSCGLGTFTKDIDLSTYTGKMVMVNVYSDTATNQLTAACIVAVPKYGGAARIIASNVTDSYITFSATNQVLTITSLGGYSFGVIARLTIV